MSAINIYCLSEAVSPITHMSRSEGNESLIAQEPIRTNDGIRWVPVLSGNSIRHRCIRAPGARHIVERLGLKGTLSLEQLNFLFHGGNLTESTGRENTKRIAEMYRLFPLLRLLGGCLPDQVLSGSLHVWRGMLLCAENEEHIKLTLPEGWGIDGVRFYPSHRYVSGYQYTRSDAEKTVGDLLPEDLKDDSESNLMIFSGQAVMRGAMFLHGFTLLHPSVLELGGLLHSLLLWAQHGTVGGQSARGHGRLKTVLLGDDPTRTDAVLQYIQHVEDTKAEAAEWLQDAFTRKQKKQPKSVRPETVNFHGTGVES
jgi:hypothetical protein